MKKTILIVEDDEDLRGIYKEILELYDFDVQIANNGLEGVEQFKKLNPDIILLDIMMPDYDGFYLLDKIYEINPQAKVIVISGDIKEETREKLETYDLLASFSKPVKFAELSKVINS